MVLLIEEIIPVEQIICTFDEVLVLILLMPKQNPMFWVIIRIASLLERIALTFVLCFMLIVISLFSKFLVIILFGFRDRSFGSVCISSL